jgi:hypothetical protein
MRPPAILFDLTKVDPWESAVREADQGDFRALEFLLTSEQRPTEWGWVVLDDYRARLEQAGKPGRRRVPIYDLSDAEARLFHAKTEARAWQRAWRHEGRKLTNEKAAAHFAPLHGVTVDALLNELLGEPPAGGIRRRRRRGKPTSPREKSHSR